jgi:hypothetical protein
MWNLIQNMNKVIDSIPGPLEESESHTGRLSRDAENRLKRIVDQDAQK